MQPHHAIVKVDSVTWRSYGQAPSGQLGAVIICLTGLINLALINWRLDVWLAPIYGVNLAVMPQLLPLSVIHMLSVGLLFWIGALLAITRPAQPD